MLTEVRQRIEKIVDRRQQSDIAASAGILAGLVLNEIIQQILKQEIMRESVIYQEIKAEGKAEGKEEKAREIALNLLNSGTSPEQVAQITGLPLEQIQSLQTFF